MITVPYLLLDVFTDTQFAGNPLAVVIDPPSSLGPDRMASIAREFNLSETIFLSPAGADRWDARIFTPVHELAFAGHPTVGGAFALALAGRVSVTADRSALVLVEGAGDVPVELRFDDGAVADATFVAPRPPALDRWVPADVTAAVLAALGLDGDDVHPDLGVGVWNAGVPILVVPVASIDVLGRARPDTARMADVVASGYPPEFYLLAPAPAGGDQAWRSRMFAPAIGIPEDPATGAAACAAAGLLASIAPDGEAAWRLEQGVEMGRPSVLALGATVRSGLAEQARLGGAAVLVGSGELRLAE